MGCICNVLSLYQVFYIKIIWTKKKILLIEVLAFVYVKFRNYWIFVESCEVLGIFFLHLTFVDVKFENC